MSELPHVTEILKAAGLVSTDFIPEQARDLGSAVHLATQYLDEGDLDVDSLDPRVALRVASYQKFLDEVKPEILGIEMSIVNSIYHYCGTLDRVIKLQDGRVGILDIKGVCASDWHGLQLSAYQCASPPMILVDGLAYRWNLYLRDDGYKLVERTRRDDWPAFVAALTLFNWRANG